MFSHFIHLSFFTLFYMFIRFYTFVSFPCCCCSVFVILMRFLICLRFYYVLFVLAWFRMCFCAFCFFVGFCDSVVFLHCFHVFNTFRYWFRDSSVRHHSLCFHIVCPDLHLFCVFFVEVSQCSSMPRWFRTLFPSLRVFVLLSLCMFLCCFCAR